MTQKEEIIKRLLGNTAEIITEEEFSERIQSGNELTHYIGFEISGYVHVGQGLMSALVMKDLADLGVKCTVWLADWHTWINDKLDGTKETAASIGQGYFTEAIKASFLAVGGNPEHLEFRLASDWYQRDMMSYMALALRVMQKTTDSRIKRSIDIMGREMGEEVEMARLLYPAMQVTDVFYQGIDIAHAGTDQRKAYVILRDVAHKIFTDKPKPLVILHPLLPRLDGTDLKMSKSDPDSAIFIHDTAEDIERKVRKAFAPERDIDDNPVLSWVKYIFFWNRTEPFRIERKEEHGGNIEFSTFKDLESAYAEGDVHPMDLKNTVTQELIALLEPVRQHFAEPDIAAKKSELDKVLATR